MSLIPQNVIAFYRTRSARVHARYSWREHLAYGYISNEVCLMLTISLDFIPVHWLLLSILSSTSKNEYPIASAIQARWILPVHDLIITVRYSQRESYGVLTVFYRYKPATVQRLLITVQVTSVSKEIQWNTVWCCGMHLHSDVWVTDSGKHELWK